MVECLINFSKKYVFMHIPKTGGTTHSTLFKKYSEINGDKFQNTFAMNIDHVIELFPETESYTFIACVRTPYERIPSLFYELKAQNLLIAFENSLQGFFQCLKNKLIQEKIFYSLTYILKTKNKNIKKEIIYFENFESDTLKILNDYYPFFKHEVPVLNKTQGSIKKTLLASCYSNVSIRNLIIELFQSDFEYFKFPIDIFNQNKHNLLQISNNFDIVQSFYYNRSCCNDEDSSSENLIKFACESLGSIESVFLTYNLLNICKDQKTVINFDSWLRYIYNSSIENTCINTLRSHEMYLNVIDNFVKRFIELSRNNKYYIESHIFNEKIIEYCVDNFETLNEKYNFCA